MAFAQKLRTSIFIGLVGFAIPGAAFASTTWTWNFTSDSNCVSNCGENFNNRTHEKTFNPVGSATSPELVASGWASTGNSNSETIVAADIVRWSSGLGVVSGNETNSSPNHATDNEDRFELVMFDFGGTSVSLTEVSFGYEGGDADFSLLAYTGSGSPSLNGVNYDSNSEGLTGSGGWTLIGNYDADNIDSSAPHDVSINTNVESSYWIVAAYNDVFGSSCDPSGYCQDSPYKDYFKIKSLTGKHTPPPPPPNGVPVPGTVVLMGLGIMLLARSRRYFQA